MFEMVEFDGRALPADVLDWILDFIWLGTEEEQDYKSLFTPAFSKEATALNVRWETICTLSRSSRPLRKLCLPRMTGSLYFRYFKTIGLFWKAVQLNPLLGTFTHTCYLRLFLSIWPRPNTPSPGLERAFRKGAAKEALAELKNKEGDHSYAIESITKWERVGSDGGRHSGLVINNPAELKQALTAIARSWTRLHALHWETLALPLLTEVIEHIESLGTLKSLSVCIPACEERYYLSQTLSPAALDQTYTPIWKLSQQVSYLSVEDFAHAYPQKLEESILNSQVDALTEALQKAKQLKTLYLPGFLYPLDHHNQERYQDFLRATLPSLVRIPTIETNRYILTGGSAPYRRYLRAMVQLQPQMEALSTRKRVLEDFDIIALGRKASEEKDHPLACFSHLLQEGEVAKEMAKEWNQKQAPSSM